MRFGMNLLLWSDQADDPRLLPVLERLAELGFDGVEVPLFDIDEAACAALGRRLDELGLARTAVSVCSADADPSSADAAVRQAGVDLLRRRIDASAACGAEMLCGPIYAPLGVLPAEGPSAAQRQRAADSLRQAAEHAQQAGVVLVVEWLNRFEIQLLTCAAEAVDFVRLVDHPACRLMYDTFHAHIEEKDPVAAIARSAPYLAHVHVSENDRSTPGAGQVPWSTTFDALVAQGYDGWLTIEAFGRAMPHLAAATRIWRPMFADEIGLAAEGLAFLRAAHARAAAHAPA